jgi:tetratricopeptide (TPR) repeat protein
MRKAIVLSMLAVLLVLSVLLPAGCGSSSAAEHNERGDSLVEEQRYEEAIDEYSKAIEIEPNLASTYLNRGAVAS